MAVSLREIVSFGRYEPLFRIASGGMAEVYAARIRGEAGFQKLVAIKRMHPHLASDATFVAMFLNEARLAAHIASPYVVQTLDLGRGSDGSLYIVMELVVGLSLAAFEHEEGWRAPVPIALELMAQAAQGLDDAHEATTPAGDELGLIHRDVSPHNILVGIDGRARVTDFGIARAIHAPRLETNVKELKGKFGYMSPEQTRLHPLDRRSDLFSLGVVLWEMLVGERLFAERDPADCIRNVRNKGVPPPHEVAPGVPPAVSKVVLKALERLPSSRFQTGAEFADALRQVGRDELGGLPRRKEISAFVKAAGGEELDRLQRLIRLGTEGTDSDAMEAIREGSTRVLTPGASGVARVGTHDTDVGADDPPKIVTVILPDDDEAFENDTVTALVLLSDELFLAQGADEDEEDAETAAFDALEPSPDPSLETPTVERSSLETPTVDVGAKTPHRTGLLTAGVLVVAAVLVGLGVAFTLAVPEDDLPVESLPSSPARTAEPSPPPAVVQPLPDPVEAPADEPDEPSAAEEADDEAPRARRRRRRRSRPDRGAARPSDEDPVLLDVDAFDQQPR